MGRVGELALALYVMVTSDGRLELFTPVSDDDHVDVTVSKHGGIPAIAIQVKATPHLDANGLAECNASYAVGKIREHPAFMYVVLLMSSVAIQTAWAIPSKDFNRLCYSIRERGQGGNRVVLEFRAYPDRDDRWRPFRVPADELGSHLLALIDSLDETIPPGFLDDNGGLVLGVKR